MHWCTAAAHEALGSLDLAREHWEKAALDPPQARSGFAASDPTSAPKLLVYRALSLSKLGRDGAGDEALAEALGRLREGCPSRQVGRPAVPQMHGR